MLKTVKGKVIVGTVAVGLLSSAGVALRTSTTRQNLKVWVDQRAGQVFSSKKHKNSKYQPFGNSKI